MLVLLCVDTGFEGLAVLVLLCVDTGFERLAVLVLLCVDTDFRFGRCVSQGVPPDIYKQVPDTVKTKDIAFH